MGEEEVDYEKVVTASLLWDMLEPEFVPFLCEDMGITIPDTDVADKESAASRARRDNVLVLAPMAEAFSVIAAEIDAAVSIRTPAGAPPEDLEEAAFLRGQWEMQAHGTIFPAVMAILAQLTERGYLEVTPKARLGQLFWALPAR